MSEEIMHLLVCRAEFEGALMDEILQAGLRGKVIEEGLLLVNGELPSRPFVFERQRLPRAQHAGFHRLQPLDESIAADILEQLRALPALWTVHTYALPEDSMGLGSRAAGMGKQIARLVGKADPAIGKREVTPERVVRRGKGAVVQLVLIRDGLWWSVAPVDAITDPHPGGVRRMKFDEDAPSRSYLKAEEAFERLADQPKAGQRAIDLGAAPGGWTYALAKRGCDVISVDNGPLNIQVPTEGRVTHVEAEGLTFTPNHEDLPVDWLLADMLIAPGPAFGLLRRWTAPGMALRLVVNIKLPQDNPWPVLQPILEFLHAQTDWDITVRQLYHDRREVTVLGRHKMLSESD